MTIIIIIVIIIINIIIITIIIILLRIDSSFPIKEDVWGDFTHMHTYFLREFRKLGI